MYESQLPEWKLHFRSDRTHQEASYGCGIVGHVSGMQGDKRCATAAATATTSAAATATTPAAATATTSAAATATTSAATDTKTAETAEGATGGQEEAEMAKRKGRANGEQSMLKMSLAFSILLLLYIYYSPSALPAFSVCYIYGKTKAVRMGSMM